MTTEMQKHLQTQDTDDDVFVKTKLYSQKRIRHSRDKRKLSVSLESFTNDLHVFDAEIRSKYNNTVIRAVMKLIFKKAAERIVKKRWRMPFPNGFGSLYIQEAQVTGVGMKSDSKSNLQRLLDEIYLGLKRSFLKWNKTGCDMPYRKIWKVARSLGYFRNLLTAEIIDRAEDPAKKSYRGHLT